MQTVTPRRLSPVDGDSPGGSGDWTESSSPTEVFDIGHDSEDDGVGPISSAVRALNVDAVDAVEGVLAPKEEKPWAPWAADRSPESGGGEGSTAPSSISKAVVDGSKERADVWTVEDWDKQLARLKEVPTPCRVPDGIDAKHKQVADAIRAELQVDLEALVNAAMDEMRSWVSQEVAFARSSFREEANKFIGNQELSNNEQSKERLEVSELKSKIKENEQLLEKLMKDLQEGRHIKRSDEEPRAATSSERVAEARAVAEERKWRLRLEHFETSMARTSEELTLCLRKISELEECATGSEAELQRGLATIQSSDGRIAEAVKETQQLRQSSEKQVEELRHLAAEMDSLKATQKELNGLQMLIGQHDERLNTLQEQSAQHQQKLMDQHDERLSTLREESAQYQEAAQKELTRLQMLMGQHDERLSTLDEERAQEKEDAQSELSNLQNRLSTLRDESAQYQEAAQNELNSLHTLIGQNDERLSTLQEESVQYQKDAQSELSNLQKLMDQHDERLSTLREESAQYQEATQKEQKSLQMLIGQHDEQLSTLQEESVQYQQDAQSELSNLQKLMDRHDERLSTLREESAQYQEAAQKELNSLQRLIGQHDERLSTLHEDRAQEREERYQETSTYQKRFVEHEEIVKALQKASNELGTHQRQQKEELLSMTTMLREMHGLSAACRSESMSFDPRMESALNRLQEVSLQVMKQEEQLLTTSGSMQTMLSDLQSCKDGVARSSMRLDHHQEALDHLNNRRCAMETRVASVEEEVLRKFQVTDREVAQNERDIAEVQGFLETHAEQLEDFRCRHGMQEERLRHVETTMEDMESKVSGDRQELEKLSDEVLQQGQRLEVTCLEATEQSKLFTAFIDRLENQEASLQRLEGSCNTITRESDNLKEQLDAGQQRLEQMEEQLTDVLKEMERQPKSEEMRQMQSHLETLLEDTGKWREAMDRMELALESNVSKEELKQMHGELQTWITDTRQALDR